MDIYSVDTYSIIMPDKQKPKHQPISKDHAQGKEARAVANSERTQGIFDRILCWLGYHDDRVIDGIYGFGPGGSVQRVECKRCGRLDTRLA